MPIYSFFQQTQFNSISELLFVHLYTAFCLSSSSSNQNTRPSKAIEMNFQVENGICADFKK